MVEWAYTSFLCQIARNQPRWNPYETWVTPAAGDMREAAWMQLAATYIGHRKVAVVQWVAMHPIF